MNELDEVIAAELRLLDPAVRASQPALLGLLDGGFREIGASGQEWDRASIIELPVAETPVPAPQVDQIRAEWLGTDVVLLTYRTSSARRVTLRSSLWRRSGDAWKLRFHQGTVMDRS